MGGRAVSRCVAASADRGHGGASARRSVYCPPAVLARANNLFGERGLRCVDIDEAEAHLRQRLLDAGFAAAHPDPALAWEVFKQFVEVPVQSGGGRECEEVWFEAADGNPAEGWTGYFDFVRMFNQYTENDACWHEMITVRFACPPEAQLGLRGSIHADLNDLPAFFRTVEESDSFQAGLGYSGWSFEVRVDSA